MSSPSNPLTLIPQGQASKRIDLDNLIRRELRVGDPSDPKQIAEALMKRYADTPTARSLVNEARGLPFLQQVAPQSVAVAVQTPTSLDLQQARDDIETDLRELITHNLLKDIQPELQGWAQAIRAAIQQGVQSAALGLDTRQRDKTFAIRRQLGDYARAARLVGALNGRATKEFRSLAQSLDELAAVLLVTMGESMANTGLAGGRYLLQVPFTELQARRESALYALRNLNGATQTAYGPDDWPRGVEAYRRLLDMLEQQGQGDLRALLTEAELARVMDELIDRAGRGVDGLRALGSTAQIDLQRFLRLIAAIQWGLHDTDSPPLTALQSALQLFIDGFKATGGIRLIGIARPQILNYGLYGNKDITPAEERLQTLLRQRGKLATLLDCYTECDCDTTHMRVQILLDKALYDVDRAIDLYAIGTANDVGEPEVRAAAYGYVVNSVKDRAREIENRTGPYNGQDTLLGLIAELLKAGDVLDHLSSDDAKELLLHEMELQVSQEQNLCAMARQLGDGCGPIEAVYGDGWEGDAVAGDIPNTLNKAAQAVEEKCSFILPPDFPIRLPSTLETSNDQQVLAALSAELEKLKGQVEAVASKIPADGVDAAGVADADEAVRVAHAQYADVARKHVGDPTKVDANAVDTAKAAYMAALDSQLQANLERSRKLKVLDDASNQLKEATVDRLPALRAPLEIKALADDARTKIQRKRVTKN